jgi:MarR-like DNA-binding transcriptional regulator SgrR of sgrS sRNA
MKQIRTYMSWTEPIDPAKIISIADMDLSFALASTLVEWDQQKQIRGALAASWRIVREKTYRFDLQPNLKWSNGTPLTCEDVKRSFERGLQAHPIDHRSLTNLLDRIECTARGVDFVLKSNTPIEALLGKLTEANFGVLKVVGGDLDLSVTSGAFFLDRKSSHELSLKANHHWIHFSSEMAEEVLLRRPALGMKSATALLNDSWPNLSEVLSIVQHDVLAELKSKGFKILEKPLDRVCNFQISERIADQEGFQLLKYLRQKIDRRTLVDGFVGLKLSEQIFPPGYELHDPEFTRIDTRVELPKRFRLKPLEVMLSSMIPEAFHKNLSKALTGAMGKEPKMTVIDLGDMVQKKLEGNYDLYFGFTGLADPDPEGLMSYYIDNRPAVIPQKDKVFLQKLDKARKIANRDQRVSAFRKILSDAVDQGYFLPLFHLSTLAIFTSELDLSEIPMSEETVTFSKVRFPKPKP